MPELRSYSLLSQSNLNLDDEFNLSINHLAKSVFPQPDSPFTDINIESLRSFMKSRISVSAESISFECP